MIGDSFTGSLLAHREIRFKRERRGAESRDEATGAPIEAPLQSRNVNAWFTWMTTAERADYDGDAAAYLLTKPGVLRQGDFVTGAPGRFLVLTVKSQGDFDRCDVRGA